MIVQKHLSEGNVADGEVYYNCQKSLNTFYFLFCIQLSSPTSPKQCCFLGEAHPVMEKLHVRVSANWHIGIAHNLYSHHCKQANRVTMLDQNVHQMGITSFNFFCFSKLITYGKTRNDAIETMGKALDSYVIRGRCFRLFIMLFD